MTSEPPPIYDDQLADSRPESLASAPIINIVPTSNRTTFQKGYLGADFERAALEGEVHIKDAESGQWDKVTIALRTIETVGGQEVELYASETTLRAPPSVETSGVSSTSSYPFSIPLQPDTPQCVHSATSSLTHTLVATLYPTDIHLPALTKSQTIHTRRYTSHTYIPGVSPETEVIDEPTRVELQVPRTTFKAGEPIPLYLTVPVPSRELVAERGIRLRNIRAELVRVVNAQLPLSHAQGLQRRQRGPSDIDEPSSSAPAVQKRHGFASSRSLDLRSVLGVPGGGEVVALSGASCRLHPTRPLRIRLVLHSPYTPELMNLPNDDTGSAEARDRNVNVCASISQTTVLHTVSFTIYVHITFIHMGNHTERVATVSVPIVIVPPSAPLPEVEESVDNAYRKKHDRPPTRTTRVEDTDVPHYDPNEAGPSYLGNGAPPPFEEREAPPPFHSSAPSTSRLPTFLESETEIFVPPQEETSLSPAALSSPAELSFTGEGSLYGFSGSDQFDGYAQEQEVRANTPPPTLEMATRDPDLTDFATMSESVTIDALELALEHHPNARDPHLPLPPPLPPIDDPSDPPPSIDSDFRIPAPTPRAEAPPAFLSPAGASESPLVSSGTTHAPGAHGHAPPPYATPDNGQGVGHVTHPPPYVG